LAYKVLLEIPGFYGKNMV